jgi:hypothetical protein
VGKKLMQKDIFLKPSTMNSIPFDLIENVFRDPISFTENSRIHFETKYIDLKKEIQKAINNRCPAIHIKNSINKNFNVTTPYCGKVNPEGIKDLIWHTFGIVGAINTFPFFYKDESDCIIRAVAPRYNSQDEHSSQSPFNDLDWHVDAAYRPINGKENLSPMPDYLIFGIVKNGYKNIPITYIFLNDILKYLDEEDIEAGMRPDFIISSPDSFSNKYVNNGISVLSRNQDGVYNSRIAFQYTKPLTESADRFLKKTRFITEVKEIQRLINVKPGDIVILNNKTTLHKRDKFEPRWDGDDRYFIRVYSTTDIKRGVISDQSKKWVWT